MNKKHLNHSFESMTPTTEQKQRMLGHILAKHSEDSPKSSKAPLTPFKLKRIVAIAASLLLIASSAILLENNGVHPPEDPSSMPNAAAPMEQLIYYNDTSYRLLGLLNEDEISQLEGPIDTVEHPDGTSSSLWRLEYPDGTSTLVIDSMGAFYKCEVVN